jgi:hypothetical protein
MKTKKMSRSGKLLGALALSVTVLWPAVVNAEEGDRPTGTWYLAMETGPFGLPGFTFAGLAIFNRDNTFLIEDGGDFGGLPFGTVDGVQFGSWRRTGGYVEAVSLFLRGDAITGAVQSWQKAHLVLLFDGPDRLVGTANVFELPCDLPAPFPVLGCPDPIASATDFVAVPPFDIPIVLKRLKAGFVSPD